MRFDKKETFTLTEKETIQLNRFRDGMDDFNKGWLHEMEEFSGKTLSGVVSSLVKKGLIVTSEEEGDEFVPSCYWVTVTEKGQL